ncbi:MAG TPA: SDR family NAD(P)-dependent oxidoreductase [Thermoanaerobaculia bacterium]|jgi:CDP-paratose 2-epimerase
MRIVSNDSYILITGGCGFVGTNLAHRFLSEGHRVCVFDNLSRPGVERNLEWLRQTHGDKVIVKVGDVRDAGAVRDAVRRASHVFHLAAQVAVTTSLGDPLEDFDINARGTLHILEAIRNSSHKPALFFTSTNKVYGGLDDVALNEERLRYTPASEQIAGNGISELRALDFHSPYGCSKGTADQYVLDYSRSYGLKTVVFRMSCIYGPHQFGTEDQGWVAHFLIRALNRQPITIYGDGKQVRDVLFVSDLVDAFQLALKNVDLCSGQAFNIGGGAGNTISLRELLAMLRKLDGRDARVDWGEWRTGDQKYYVSDSTRFRELTSWTPTMSVTEGIRTLREWLIEFGVPALVQQGDDHPAALAATAAIPAGRDVPVVATAPVTE